MNDHLHESHHKAHHKMSILTKMTIWIILAMTTFILFIYLLGSQKPFAPKTLSYHPLYLYMDWQLKENKINPKKILEELFPVKRSVNQKSKGVTEKKGKSNNMVNIVYQNATQSYQFDNWLFFGDYLSFLVNKHTKIIQKKVVSRRFAELYQRFKSQTQSIQQDQVQQVQIEYQVAQSNEEMFFKFSDEFQNVFETQDVYINQLTEKTIFEKIKEEIDVILDRIHQYFRQNNETQIDEEQENQVWVLYLLHLNGQPLNQIRKELKLLQRRYQKDKFIILTLYPLLKQSQTFNVVPISPKIFFPKLMKLYINTTQTQSRLISNQFQNSLLKLSSKVSDEQSFTMYHLVGGRLGYSDLQRIPSFYLDKVKSLCNGQKIRTQKFLQEEEKIQFYRIGLYKLGQDIMWKSKDVKRNYEFQTGQVCKKIPVFHNDYIEMYQTLKKTYLGFLFKK